MGLLPASIPSGTGAGVKEVFTFSNPAVGKFEPLGFFVVTPGNIPPLKGMRPIWLKSINKVFAQNPDSANNLFLLVNKEINQSKLHWTDLFALSTLAENVQNDNLTYHLRSYKAGNRIFSEPDLLKVYKNILLAPGTRDYNSEVANLVIQEANALGNQLPSEVLDNVPQSVGADPEPNSVSTAETRQPWPVAVWILGVLIAVVAGKYFKQRRHGR